MSSFDALKVSPKIARGFDEGPAEDDIVFGVTLPENSDGLEGSMDLFTAFHRPDSDSNKRGLFGRGSDTACSLEIWYENEELKFVFYLPSEREDEYYRRQLAGHYRGISLDEKVDRSEKFISLDDGDYVAATRLKLRKHYFEPIGNPITGDGEVDQDPYQTILNEADTKDDDMKMVIQFLYKPAPEGWTSYFGSSAESYAEALEETGTSNPRMFGFRTDTVENTDARRTGASNIRARVNKMGYHINARVLVASPDKDEVERHLNSLTSLFETTYMSPTKQTLIADPPISRRHLLRQMITRTPQRMKVPSGPTGLLSTLWRGASDRMILTIPEFSGVVHLPSSNDITVDGLNWTDTPVKGTLPPESRTFEPVTPAEVQAALTRDELGQVADVEPDLLFEFDEPVTEAHTGIPDPGELTLEDIDIATNPTSSETASENTEEEEASS